MTSTLTMAVRRVLAATAAMAGLCIPVGATAQVWATATCGTSGCHSLPPAIANTVADNSGSYTLGLGEAWMASAAALKTRVNAAGATYSAAMENLTSIDAAAVFAYLERVRDAEVSSPSPTFSSTVVSSSRTSSFSFTIANYRGEAITYSLPLSGGNAAGDFSVQSHTVSGVGCTPGSVPATAIATPSTCTVNLTVRFQPTAVGTRNTTLLLNLAAASNPQPPDRSIALSAQATSQFVLNSTAALNFGSITATTTQVLSRIITNAGSTSFSLGTPTFGGASPALYSLAGGNACTAGLTLLAGSSCQLDVQFAPLAEGSPLNATLTITHNAAGSPQPAALVLLGAATAAPRSQVGLSEPSPLAYPDTQLGSSAVRSITVRNTGDATLVFTDFTKSGTAAADYVQSGTCGTGSPLAINATCTLTLTFQPGALGARTAVFTIESNASNAPTPIALSGTGVPVPAPVASLAPAALAFGSQTVGGLYPNRSVTLTNDGTADLAVASVALTGAGFGNASLAACPPTLVPGAACTVDIAFTPAAAGVDYSGALTVISNAAGSPHAVPLSGRGESATLPVLVWSPALTQLDFGLVAAGIVSAPQSANLLNNGPGGVTLNVINAVGADGAAFVVDGGTCQAGVTLFQGQSCQVVVRFAPGSAGGKNASVQVASTGSLPPALALVGNGLAGADPGLSLSVGTLAFDRTRIGAQSLPLGVTLLGSGSTGVSVTALDISGPYAMHSSTCPALPFVLQAGSSCAVTLAFEPQAPGPADGMLRVTSDATPAQADVALSAVGESPAELSGGGCSIAQGDRLADPTLWVLVLLAAGALFYRRSARTAPRPEAGRPPSDPPCH